MKKRLLIGCFALICALSFSALFMAKTEKPISVLAEETATVTVDGTNYTDIVTAMNALPESGGKIIVSANTSFDSAAVTTLPAKPVIITAENDAVIGLGKGINLSASTTFENVTLDQTVSAANIYAYGNPIVIGENVTVNNTSGGTMPIIYGGTNTTALDLTNTTGGSSVTIKSGSWYRVIGANENAAFTGDINVEICGTANIINNVYGTGSYGKVTTLANGVNVKVHGNTTFGGQFYGAGYRPTLDASKGGVNVEIGGNATFSGKKYLAGGFSGGTWVAGDINLTIKDNATVSYSYGVYGGAQNGTTNGNVNINIEGSPTITKVQGTLGPVNGDVTLSIKGTPTFSGTYTANSSSGAISGNITTILGEGMTLETVHVGTSGTKRYTGDATVIIDGATVTDLYCGTSVDYTTNVNVIVKSGTVTNVYGGNSAGTLSGNSTITLTGGTITNVYGAGIGAVSGETSVTIDGATVTNVYGGANTAFSGNTNVYMKSGTVTNLYGGNEVGAFTGDAYVEVTGGTVTTKVVGGNAQGNFTGNTYVIVSGGTVDNVYGGTIGVSGKKSTFNGVINIDVCGDAVVEDNIYPASYYGGSNTVTNATINTNVYGNATVNANVYGLGYNPNLTSEGGVFVTVGGNATINGSVIGGSYHSDAKFTGNIFVTIEDNPVITGDVAGGGKGAITGDTSVTIKGGTFKNASAVGSGAVSGNKTLVVDLTTGGTVNVTGTITATNILGGSGKIVLAQKSSIVTETVTNVANVTLGEEGIIDTVYVTINDLATTGEINYISIKDDIDSFEKVVGDVITYVYKDTSFFETTLIRFNFYNSLGLDQAEQPKFGGVYKGIHTEEEGRVQLSASLITKGSENGIGYATFEVGPGLYYATISYSSGGYIYKYFYVSGREATDTYEVAFAPYEANNYSEKTLVWQTDEILDWMDMDKQKEANPDAYEMYPTGGYDTPTFTKYANNPAKFLTNADLCDYANNLANSSDRIYVYYPFEGGNSKNVLHSEYGLRWPIIVASKHDLSGMSWEDAGEFIRARKGEVFMTAGGVHGNEPAGVEGNLAFAKDLAGSYGDKVIDFFEAIVVMPAISIDNLQRYVRSDPETGRNPNRDLMQVKLEGTEAQIRAFNNFMPTVHVDCHEDYGRFLYNSAENSVANDKDAIDVAIRNTSNQNSPTLNPKQGHFVQKEQRSFAMMMGAIEYTRTNGLEPHIYYVDGAGTVAGKGHFTTLGCMDFIVEVLRMSTGKTRYARAVYALNTALKGILEQQMSYDGEIAKEIYAAREALESSNVFDENKLFALKHDYKSGLGDTQYLPRVTYKPDGTKVYVSKGFTFLNQITSVRALPTAYVIDGRNQNLPAILRLLDIHGIPYTELRNGAELTLRRYQAGTDGGLIYQDTTIDEATSVTFPNGAIAVSMNNMYAYLSAYLFEPDCAGHSPTSDTSIMSLAHMDLIDDSDYNTVYRSEVDNVYLQIRDLKRIDTPVEIEKTNFNFYSEYTLLETRNDSVLLDAPTYSVEGYQFVGWYNEELGLLQAGTNLANVVKDLDALPLEVDFEAVFVNLSMINGASVRIVGNQPTGLEFYTKYDITNTIITDRVSFNTIIAPTDTIIDVDFTEPNFPAGSKGLVTNSKYLRLSEDGSYSYYQGSIVNIFTYNYAREFSARGFITVTYADTSALNFYADYDKELNSRSIYEVAVNAYADRKTTADGIYKNNTGDGWYSRFSDNDLKIIKKYIDGVVNITYENGTVKFANPYADVVDGFKTYVAPYEVATFNGMISITADPETDWTYYQQVGNNAKYYRVSLIINGRRETPNSTSYEIAESTSDTKVVDGLVKIVKGVITFDDLGEQNLTSTQIDINSDVIKTINRLSNGGTAHIIKDELTGDTFFRSIANGDIDEFVGLRGYFIESTKANETYKITMVLRTGTTSEEEDAVFTLQSGKGYAFRFGTSGATQSLATLYNNATPDEDGWRTVEFTLTPTTAYTYFWVFMYGEEGSYIDINTLIISPLNDATEEVYP